MTLFRKFLIRRAWTRFVTPIGLLGPVALLSLTACGGDDSTLGSPGNGGQGGSGGAIDVPTSLAFDPATTLTLVPGEEQPIALDTDPPGVYRVRFALLGDFQDASLDKSEVDTDSSGHAELSITAPSSATTFSVRASVADTVSTTIGVSVSASGFATLQVVKNYDGARTFSYLMASVRTGVTCAELANQPLSDGDITGSSPQDGTPQIDGAPVGPTLAVTLRGAFSVAGCQEVNDLVAGEINETVVTMTDLPMTLDDTDLEITLGIDTPTGGFGDILNPNTLLSASPFGASNDVDVLLDAMQDATADASEAQQFQAARKTDSWDLALVPTLGGPVQSQNALRSLIAPWLLEGASSLIGPSALEGTLKAAGTSPGKAFLSLDSIAGIPAEDAGLPPQNLVSWKADAGDTVLLGTAPSLLLLPSRVLGALALTPAKSSVPTAQSVPEALAELLPCSDVAGSIAAAASPPGQAYPGCTTQCVEDLCRAGTQSLWKDFLDSSASSKTVADLSVTATAAAVVDDVAAPMSFDGSWVGSISFSNQSLALSGSTSGKKPTPPR